MWMCIQYLSLTTPSLHSGCCFQSMCDSTLKLFFSCFPCLSIYLSCPFFLSFASFFLFICFILSPVDRLNSNCYYCHTVLAMGAYVWVCAHFTTAVLILFYSKWNQLFVIIWDRFDKHYCWCIPFSLCAREREYVRCAMCMCVCKRVHLILVFLLLLLLLLFSENTTFVSNRCVSGYYILHSWPYYLKWHSIIFFQI